MIIKHSINLLFMTFLKSAIMVFKPEIFYILSFIAKHEQRYIVTDTIDLMICC